MRIASVRSEKAMLAEDWTALREDAEQLFTPGTAVKEQDLFAGRAEQISKLAQRIRLAGCPRVAGGFFLLGQRQSFDVSASRRSSSRSTASRIRSDRFSFGFNTPSILASVPFGR